MKLKNLFSGFEKYEDSIIKILFVIIIILLVWKIFRNQENLSSRVKNVSISKNINNQQQTLHPSLEQQNKTLHQSLLNTKKN